MHDMSMHVREPELTPLVGIGEAFMVEAEAAGNLVVVRTHPGNASPVARSLDTIGWKEIVGTVAGDDTILVVTANAAAARLIKQRLRALGG